MKIGIFDSGLGGLTIFKEILNQVKADFIYLGDNKNTPYGIKEKSVVKEYIFKNIKILIDKGCKIIVIACNTATMIAIDELRVIYPNIIFIGTEPAVKKAFDENGYSKSVIVSATTITVNSEKLKKLVDSLGVAEMTKFIPLDKLVKFAENENVDLNIVKDYIKENLKDIDLSKFSHIVLGCSHFPIFKKQFEEIVGPEIKVIDGSIGISNHLKQIILEENMIENSSESNIQLIITKENLEFLNNFKRILGNDKVDYLVEE